jgi:hypothetical protein
MGGDLDPETNQQSSGAPRKSGSLRFTNNQGVEKWPHHPNKSPRISATPKNPQAPNLNAESRPSLSRNQAGDGVHRGQGKIRSSLNGWRHGLTGQVLTMAEEDREAFEKFAREMRLAYFPVGALELQIAQSIAEDEWRLNRARAMENNVIALGHSGIAGEVETINTQMHAAMTQARVFWRNPEKFALLSLYEQRISRKVLKNEERLRAIQTERKATQMAEAAAEKKAQPAPKPQMASVVRMPNPTPTTPETPTNSASEMSKSGTPQ